MFNKLINKKLNIVLTGNPNSGKSSLFNALTGLKQKIGNFPGVTVDKKIGKLPLDEVDADIIDLPGTYSLYPRRADEWVAYKVLMGLDEEVKPDLILIVLDASNLKRNLLFCSQVIDLKIPVVAALSMTDIAASKNIRIDINGLQQQLGIPIVNINPRKNKGLSQLKKVIALALKQKNIVNKDDFIDVKSLAPTAIEKLQSLIPVNDYKALHYLINYEEFELSDTLQSAIGSTQIETKFNPTKTQAEEVIGRYQRIKQIMQLYVTEPNPLDKKIFTDRLDNILFYT